MSEELANADDDARARNKVILNVGGMRHETFVGTLGNIPDSRLSSLINNNPTQVPEFDQNSGEFFFDRHPLVFAQILNYYRTGKLHCPSDVCGPVFEEELAFWGLEDASIETCCWMNYKKHGEAQANLSSFDKIIEDAASEHESIFCDERNDETPSFRAVLRKYRSRVWVTLEEPSSSFTAKIIALLSMLLIITSVIISCLETMEYFSHSTQHEVLHILEVICIAWFTAEFVIRFTVSPKKRKFLKQIMNWVDFAAIVPFYIQLFLTNTDMNSILALRIVRLIRVFRVFKLSRHSYSLQILGHTLKSSLSELFLLMLFLGIGVVVFSTLMFYAEHGSENLEFTSIPAGFWWAVVTMTTLGYGDIVPHTIPGRLVGGACAVSGVLMIALPIPVIVSNFSLYYSHAKAKQKLTQRKRPIVIGAANALKVIDPFLGSRTTNLRFSVMSDNASCVSPVPPVRAFSKNIQRMGSSVEGSESPASQKRRLSRLPDKFWQMRTLELRNSERYKNNSSKTSNDNSSGKDSEDSSKDFQTNSDPRGSEDISTPERQFSNSMSTTFNAGEEKTLDAEETKITGGADDNNAVERMSDNDHSKRNVKYDEDTDDGSDKDNTPESKHQSHNTLPKIEVIRNSSGSQMSASNSDIADKFNEETKSGKNLNKKTKKLRKSRPSVEKATSAPALGAQVSRKNPPGRMGRRGSVFVVGFLGKRWQAKAAKSRMNRMRRNSKLEEMQLSPVQHHKTQLNLLHVSPSLSNKSTTIADSRRTSTTSFTSPNSSVSLRSNVFRFPLPIHPTLPESSFSRRSSCPNLFTPKVVQNVWYNNQNARVIYQTDECHNTSKHMKDIDEICSKAHEVREVDGKNKSLRVRSNIIKVGENSSDIKHPAENMKDNNNSYTKNNGDDKNAEDDTTDNQKDAKHNRQGTERSGTDINSKNEENTNANQHNYNTDNDVDDTKDNGDNAENKENLHRSESKQYEIKDEITHKQDMSGEKRWSLSSESNYSVKASFEQTARRYSAPLIRQKALRSIKGHDVGKMKSSGWKLRRSSSKNTGTCSAQTCEQDFNKNGETTSRDTSKNKMKPFPLDLNAVKNGCSTLTWVEIGKTQSSNITIPAADKIGKYNLKTFENECDVHTEYKNTSSNQARSYFDPVHKISENTTQTDGESIQALKETQAHKNILTKQETTILGECQCVFAPVEGDKRAINGRPGANSGNSSTNETETYSNHHHTNLGNRLTDDRNVLIRTEAISERLEGNKAHNKKFLNSFDKNMSEHQSNNLNLILYQEKPRKREGMRMNGPDHILHRNPQHNMINDFDRDQSRTKNFSCSNSNSGESHVSQEQLEKRKTSNAVRKDNMDLIYPNHNPENQVHSLKISMSSQTKKDQSLTLPTVHKDQNISQRRDNVHDLSYPNYYSRKSAYPGRLADLLDSSRNSQFEKDHYISAEHKDENTRRNNGNDTHDDYNQEQTERPHDAFNFSIHSHFKSSQDTYNMDKAMPRNLEAQDSGICCMDHRSSIDSLSSFTERNYDRQILKTISEVELDSDYRDGMIYQSFSYPYYEKSRSHVLEIRDETTV